MKNLQNALELLEVKGEIITKWITTDRIAVYLDGEYFGIWDINKRTFVD